MFDVTPPSVNGQRVTPSVGSPCYVDVNPVNTGSPSSLDVNPVNTGSPSLPDVKPFTGGPSVSDVDVVTSCIEELTDCHWQFGSLISSEKLEKDRSFQPMAGETYRRDVDAVLPIKSLRCDEDGAHLQPVRTVDAHENESKRTVALTPSRGMRHCLDPGYDRPVKQGPTSPRDDDLKEECISTNRRATVSKTSSNSIDYSKSNTYLFAARNGPTREHADLMWRRHSAGIQNSEPHVSRVQRTKSGLVPDTGNDPPTPRRSNGTLKVEERYHPETEPVFLRCMSVTFGNEANVIKAENPCNDLPLGECSSIGAYLDSEKDSKRSKRQKKQSKEINKRKHQKAKAKAKAHKVASRRPKHDTSSNSGSTGSSDSESVDSSSSESEYSSDSSHYEERYRQKKASKSRHHSHKYRLKPEPPEPYGGSANLREFQTFCEDSMDYVREGNVRKNTRVKKISRFLTGNAKAWYISTVADDVRSWRPREFFVELYNYSFPTTFRMSQHIALVKTTQGNRTVRDYILHLNELFNTPALLASVRKC